MAPRRPGPVRRRRRPAARVDWEGRGGGDGRTVEVDQTVALDERSIRLAAFYQGKIETVPKVPVRSLEDFSHLVHPRDRRRLARDRTRSPDRAFELTGPLEHDRDRDRREPGPRPRRRRPARRAARHGGEGAPVQVPGRGRCDPAPARRARRRRSSSRPSSGSPRRSGRSTSRTSPRPKCFYVLEELQKRLPIPVWHDDQLGTAAATVAGLLNALALTGGRSARSAPSCSARARRTSSRPACSSRWATTPAA